MRAMQMVEVASGKLSNGAAVLNPFYKEPSQRLLYRKASWIRKLIILILIGLSGMYICILGIKKHGAYQKTLFDMARGTKEGSRSLCIQSKTNVVEALSVHYPQPATFDRKECSCTPVHYFILFSMQRSGSGWLEALLNSHPNINSHGEVFLLDGSRENMSAIKRTLDTIYNLDWVSSASKNDCTMAVGLKWMLNQGIMEYHTEIAAYLKEKSVSVIFLFRRNILRRYVSILANSFDRDAKKLNGTHRAHVHSEEEAKILAAYKPVVNLTSLIPYLQRIEDIINDAQISFKQARHMTIYYEDLVANPQKELRGVQKFLGVKLTKLGSKHVKIHTQPFSDQIDNWGELSEFLKGTPYEMLLKDKDSG